MALTADGAAPTLSLSTTQLQFSYTVGGALVGRDNSHWCFMDNDIGTKTAARLREILAAVKTLAVEYYRLTGKPLGVTGEVAEYVAAETLGLKLAPPRTPGYDALRGKERIQIKGRAHGKKTNSGQKMGRIKKDAPCDTVLLVILDSVTLEPREMWKARFQSVLKRLAVPGSKARARGVLSIPEFTRIAERVWPAEAFQKA